jgi:hypothetical protein
MTYHNVAQIFETIDETRSRLFNRVGGLSDEQVNSRPDKGAWTVAEIVEHLAIIENKLLRMMTVMLTKAEGAGAASGNSPVEIKPFSLDKLIERSQKEKYSAPEAVRPTGEVPLADSLARMRRSRADLHALRPRVEKTNLSGATYPHPFAEALNFYEWLAFIGVHEERHLRQIESVLSS